MVFVSCRFKVPSEALRFTVLATTGTGFTHGLGFFLLVCGFVLVRLVQSGITTSYIRKPLPPIWNFTQAASGQYQFVANTSFNFELHPAEQTELILKILLYAGVVVKDPQIIQVAAQQVAQENQNQQR